MITKLILPHNFNLDEPIAKMIDVHSKGIDKGWMQKRAAMFDDIMADVKPEKGKSYIHLITTGAGEVYGPNSNGDFFNKTAKEVVIPKPRRKGMARIELDGGLTKYHNTFMKTGHVYKHHQNNKDPKHATGMIKYESYNSKMDRGELIVALDNEKWSKELQKVASDEPIYFSIGCFTEDALVTLYGGNLKKISEVCVGDVVRTHSGASGTVQSVRKLEYSHTSAVTLRPCGGLELTSTVEHPYLIIKRDKIFEGPRKIGDFVPGDAKWVEAKDIKPFDYLLTPLDTEEITPDYVNKDFARLCGYYLAEGHILYNKNQKPVGVSFCANKTDRLVQEIPGILERLGARNKCYTHARTNTTEAVDIQVYDKGITDILLKLLGQYSHHKYIAPSVMKWELDMQKEFLGAYHEGDGCFYYSNDIEKKGNVYFSTCNKELALQTQQMLHRLGGLASINISLCKGGFSLKTQDKQTVSYVVRCGKKLTKELFGYSSKIKVIETEDRGSNSGYLEKGFVFTRVSKVSLEEVDKLVVYNIEVEHRDHSYLVNGVSVHNCTVPYDICSECGNKATKRSEYCFVPGTKITKADGTLCSIEDIKEGEEVLGISGNPTKITKIFERDVKEEILVIGNNLHQQPLEVTKNHPIWAIPREYGLCYQKTHTKHTAPKCYPESDVLTCRCCNKYFPQPDYIEAGSLRQHDFLFAPTINKQEEKWNNFCDEKDAWVYGLFLAEGSYGKQSKKEGGKVRSSIQFSLHEKETEYVEKLQLYFKEKWNKDLKVYAGKTEGHKGISCRIHSVEISKLFYEICGEYAINKYIPSIFFHAPINIQTALLYGLFDGDGYIYTSHSNTVKCSRINSASINLINTTRLLLQQMGYYTYTFKYISPGGPTNRTNKVNGYSVVTDFYKESHGLNTQRGLWGTTEMGFIKSIDTKQYEGPVYNFETEEHTYIANCIAVHNCNHLKNDMLQMTKSANQIFAYNDHPSFHDISGVFRPADKIAFGLRKVASGVISSADLAELSHYTIPTEFVDIYLTGKKYDRMQVLKKLAHMEEEIDRASDESPLGIAKYAFCVGSGFDEMPSGSIDRLHSDIHQTLSEMNRAKIVLPVEQFYKLSMGDKYPEVEGFMEDVKTCMPGLFRDIVKSADLDEFLDDGTYDGSPCLLRNIKDEVGNLSETHSLANEPVVKRITVTMIHKEPGSSPSVKTIEKSSSDSSDNRTNFLAREYGKYLLSFCKDKEEDVQKLAMVQKIC